MSDEARVDAAPNLKEFRDTRLWFQYAMGGIAGVGIVGAITLFRKADDFGLDRYLLQCAAGAVVAVTLVALAVVYLKFGKPVVLRQTEYGIERECGKIVQTISYGELYGLRAKWTDVLRNGIYNHTQVRLAMCAQDPDAPEMKYESTVDYDTLKYRQLEEFQDEVVEIVARQMAVIMQSEGRVAWTKKLHLRPDGLEMTKGGCAAELIAFDRISQWKLDQGLFKLGIDGSRRPVLVEDTSQWNFYPGLWLFSELCQSPHEDSPDSTIEDEPVLTA
jgi:hypothetical protein